MARDLGAVTTSASQQRRLLQIWLSPSFPVGAFAYSHGLERAVEAGFVTDRATLRDWIADLFAHGSIRSDLILLAAAWRAADGDHTEDLGDIAELAAALHPSAERRLESVTQGGSFVDAIQAAWPVERNRGETPFVNSSGHAANSAESGLTPISSRDVAYPVAVGCASANHGIALDATLEAYATAFAGNLASAAIRLSVIGQTDAQRLQADLTAVIDQTTSFAAASTLADLGSASFSADLCSMEHETQYTRLFRS
jgi:urease accessory protein